MAIAFSVVALVFSLSVLVYAVHLALVYHRFNESVKSWAERLDAGTRDAVNRAARQILSDLDAHISENLNNQNNQEQENEEELQ